MTRTFWTTACVLAASAMSLTACATPNYPISAGATPPPPLKPRYPVSAEAAPPPAATTPPPATSPVIQAPSSAVPPPATSPSPEVQSEPLPPASGGETQSPVQSPPQSPAQKALPPGYTPPSPSPPPTGSPPASYSRSPEYTPPPVSYRPAPPRYIAGGKVVEARGMFRDYEVRKGDHVDAIARDLKTTRKVLVDANHLEPPYAVQPGQHLKVPVAKAYEVQPGDTITAVANRFSISPAALADLNDLPVKGRLSAGDKLALPDAYDDKGPTRLPSTMVAVASPSYRSAPTYRAAPSYTPSYSAPPAEGGPYTPSPAALASAQRLAAARAAAGQPSYSTARPGVYTPPRVSQGPVAPTPAAVIQAGQGRFVWPVRGDILAGFGETGLGRRNDGLDIKASQGTVVRAAAAGNVVYAGDQVPGFGNLVLIKHTDGWVTAYAHLDSITVQMRQSVIQGQAIGEVGQSGGVSQPQLHFEIRYAATPADKARPIDPSLVLPK